MIATEAVFAASGMAPLGLRPSVCRTPRTEYSAGPDRSPRRNRSTPKHF
jgi:hypothetical protein